MHGKMNVPSTIVVGYQERTGTYTGKLAYVVYKDEKGVLRKEKSWQSWRDKKIEPDELPNEPTAGFVLNKKAGGGRYGWNPRQTYSRVYDPRGWEFEITIPNLLFILQECSSIKGKGLEGEFVYAWSGTELVLMPVCSQEYKDCKEFTEAKTKKVTKKDMVPGCLYKNKDMEEVMYLGRYEYYESMRIGYRGGSRDSSATGQKRHIFLYTGKEGNRYWVQPGFTKLAERLTEEPALNFSDKLEEFLKGEHHAELDKVLIEPAAKAMDKRQHHDGSGWNCRHIIVQTDKGKVYSAYAQSPARRKSSGFYNTYRRESGPAGSISIELQQEIIIPEKGLPHWGDYTYRDKELLEVPNEEKLKEMRVQIVAVLKSGKKINLTDR